MNPLDDFLNSLPGKLEAIRRERRLPSLSAAVMVDNHLIWQEACGLAKIETELAATPEMVYPLGSISKVFIVTMLMQLVERGVVTLEDPITLYIPEYRVRSPFGKTSPATLRQLAAHTAGLPRDADINFPMNQSLAAWEFSNGQAPLEWYASAEDVLASLSTVRLELPPDTAKQYSNLGIMLLGFALERACRQNFREYIAEHIFKPLGMASAGFVDEPDAFKVRLPCGYGRSAKDGAFFKAPRWQLGAAIYTGGIYSNAADLARFCTAFMEEPSPLLSAASIRRMIHPAAMGDTHLGWWKGWHAGRANLGHAGAHVGFISAALFVPDCNLAVAVQTNCWNPIMDTGDSTEVARQLLGEFIPVIEAVRPLFDPAAVMLEAYTGSYRLPGGYASGVVTLAGKPGLLRVAIQAAGAEPMTLAPVGPHQFGPPGTQFPAVTFEVDDTGRVTVLNYALFKFYKD